MSNPTTPEDDFALFRAKRLAKARAARPAPLSGIPFFGTDRKTRVLAKDMEAEDRVAVPDALPLERGALEQEPGERSPLGKSPSAETSRPTTSHRDPSSQPAAAVRAPAEGAPRAPKPPTEALRVSPATPRPATRTPRPNKRSVRSPQAVTGRPRADAPRRSVTSAPRQPAPTVIERRRPGVVSNPPLPPKRPKPSTAELLAKPAKDDPERGFAEPMEQVVQGTHHTAARAERKVRFRRRQREGEGPQATDRERGAVRHYTTSRRIRRAEAAQRRSRSS